MDAIQGAREVIEDMGNAHYTNDGWTICSPENFQGIDVIDKGKGILLPIPHFTRRLFRVYSTRSNY